MAKLLNAQIIPTDGEIEIFGINTKNEERVWDIRQKCAMVFQNPDNQLVATVVEEDVAFGPENLGVPSEEIRQRVDEALKIVEMEEYKKHSPHMLSGGQKQRVAIAGILSMKPEVIIFDESTAMLDPIGRKDIMNTILKLNREENKTIMYITHYMEEAVLADRVIVLNEGKIEFDNCPKKVFSNVETLRELGLSVPQVTDRIFGEKIKIMDINFKNVSFIYGEKTPFEKLALDNIDLTIKKGEFVGIIGHTGSGKSTLIQHFNGILKPTSGDVFIGDMNTKDKELAKSGLRYKIGLVFQYPEYQLFEETIEKDIAFGPRNMGLSEEEVTERVKEAMEIVGLDYETKKDKSPFEISGGQKRRVAIAGILAMKPDILILDEPTAGLDPMGRDELFFQIKNLYEKNNITIVLISHSMEDVAKLVNRIIIMKDGHIHLDKKTKEAFSDVDDLKKVGLNVPQITELMDVLRKNGHNFSKNILTVDEAFSEIKRELRTN